MRADQQESLRCPPQGRRARAGGRVRHRRRTRGTSRRRPGRTVVSLARRDAARRRRRRRHDLYAVGSPLGERHRRRAGGQARRHREADVAIASPGRRSRSSVRRRGRATVRRQAEPIESAHSALEARRRQGPLRPHFHGERDRAMAAPAGLLRRRALARHVGVRRRRDHESGLTLRRPDAMARRAGRERDGKDRDPGPTHRGRGFGDRNPEVPVGRAGRDRGERADLPPGISRARSRSSASAGR